MPLATPCSRPAALNRTVDGRVIGDLVLRIPVTAVAEQPVRLGGDERHVVALLPRRSCWSTLTDS